MKVLSNDPMSYLIIIKYQNKHWQNVELVTIYNCDFLYLCTFLVLED